jgi:hypothetical protein
MKYYQAFPHQGPGPIAVITAQNVEITKSGTIISEGNRPLDPRYDLANHSPDGFQCGYGGSGPAQLALAILADALDDDEKALNLYQKFKAEIISKLDPELGWTLSVEFVESWIEAQ